MTSATLSSQSQIARDCIFREGLLSVHRVASTMGGGGAPILLVPPLMVTSDVFDLSSDRSISRWLAGQGFDVYICDFGKPRRQDGRYHIDDYVLGFLPRAIEAVRESRGERRLFLLGYCLGGLFCLLHQASTQDPDIQGIITLATPVDFSELGTKHRVARVLSNTTDSLLRYIGNVRAGLTKAVFRNLNPRKTLQRWARRFLPTGGEEAGSMGGSTTWKRWEESIIDFPREACRQFLGELVAENRLVRGTFKLRGETVDLERVTCPLLVLAGERDDLVPIGACASTFGYVTSPDGEFRVVPGGHMSVLVGSGAKQETWPLIGRWLSGRARRRERRFTRVA